MLRILILLLVLLGVALSTWQDRYRSTRWREPLYVAIYPIAADDSNVTSRYLAALDAARFEPIDLFFVREAERYRLAVSEPVKIRLRTPLQDRPPQRAPSAGIFATALWSLRLRYWAWRAGGHVKEPEDIRIFVLYHDPALTPVVPHSLGLTKGLIGVVYAFAAPEMNGANDVVIAHELLHTLGASDKYAPGAAVSGRLRRSQPGAALPATYRGTDGGTAHAQGRSVAASGELGRSGHRTRQRA
jgi:hypothetical protein